jgi:HNH endonuclease
MVRSRASCRCEYCHLPEPFGDAPYCVDHVIARKHHGLTIAENLAWACFRCNSGKADNLSGIDPMSGVIVRLFHPRQDIWTERFEWEGPALAGLDDIARATIDVLNMNAPRRLEMRYALLLEGIEF